MKITNARGETVLFYDPTNNEGGQAMPDEHHTLALTTEEAFDPGAWMHLGTQAHS